MNKGTLSGAEVTSQQYGEAYEMGGFQRTVQALLKHGARRDRAHDLAQAAWLRGWERLSQLRDSRLIVSWVIRISLNKLIDGERSGRRLTQLPSEDAPAAVSTINLSAIDVRRKLLACDPRHSRLLTHVYLAGGTRADLVRQLRISRGAVNSALSRARRALRALMTDKKQPMADAGCAQKRIWKATK